MRKQKLILLVGLPASGKSQYAKEYLRTHQNTVVVSTDRIHSDIKELGIEIKTPEDIFKEIKHRVRKSLLFEKNVVVNASNLKIDYRAPFIRLARKINKNIIIEAHVIVADLGDCIERDSKREKNFGEEFIRRQMGTFQIPVLEEGYDNIEYHYTSMPDSKTDNIPAQSLAVLLRSCFYRKMNCDALGQAVSILVEQAGAPKEVVEAGYLSLIGRAWTQDQDYAQCGAYNMLCFLLRVKKLTFKEGIPIRDRWLRIIKLINYCTLPVNFSKKHSRLFDEDFIQEITLINNCLRQVNNIEKIKEIFEGYYGKK